MKQLPVKTLPISRLLPADYNPRDITPGALQALRASLKRFGVAALGELLDEIARARPESMRELGFDALVEDPGLDDRFALETRAEPPPPPPQKG